MGLGAGWETAKEPVQKLDIFMTTEDTKQHATSGYNNLNCFLMHVNRDLGVF